MNLEIDVGARIAEILGSLANKIGTTANKVFPWYVKQQVLEGWSSIFVILVVSLISSVCALKTFKKADFDENVKETTIFVISVIIFVICLVLFSASFTTLLTQITNPEYHALGQLTRDMGNLIGK